MVCGAEVFHVMMVVLHQRHHNAELAPGQVDIGLLSIYQPLWREPMGGWVTPMGWGGVAFRYWSVGVAPAPTIRDASSLTDFVRREAVWCHALTVAGLFSIGKCGGGGTDLSLEICEVIL